MANKNKDHVYFRERYFLDDIDSTENSYLYIDISVPETTISFHNDDHSFHMPIYIPELYKHSTLAHRTRALKDGVSALARLSKVIGTLKRAEKAMREKLRDYQEDNIDFS